MYLGLDLRGGVHFLMQVDMKAALTKKADSLSGDIRTLLRDKNIRHAGTSRDGNDVVDPLPRPRRRWSRRATCCEDQLPDLQFQESQDGTDWKLTGSLKPDAATRVQEAAITQNITTLHNRVNELGVAEPVIQKQGADRVVVQLPGVQDTAKAKDIIGRTATLELRMVDDSAEARAAELGAGPVPFGDERYVERGGAPLIVKRQVVLTGENLTDAQPGFDENHEPAVHLTVDAKGARIMRDVSRENIGKRMAILLFEKGKGEVVTAPVIRGELGNRFQISGRMTTAEANDVALLLRAGSLAAPMEIIEERTIGPSLGAENIAKGFDSVIYGFIAIAVFMCVYYQLFGVISTLALAFNLLLLTAVLSMLQATLTLPGIAAVALALGMAIDSNVLINERVREELRGGAAPQVGDQHRLRARLGDDPRLERDDADRRPGAARLRLGPGARLRDRPQPGHRHLDVLGGAVLARPGQPLVRPQEAPEGGLDRPGLEAGRTRRSLGQGLTRQLALGASLTTDEDRATWSSSGSGATSRSCGMRWSSTSSRW